MAVTLIKTITAGAGGASSLDFTGIPDTFTDLMVQISVRTNRALTEDWVLLSLNGSTANFSSRILRGSGSAVSSFTQQRPLGDAPAANATANTFSNQNLYIPNYAGSTNKSFSVDSVSENNATTAWQYLISGLWSNTAAITSLTLTPEVGTVFVQGSTASLYGVKKDSILPQPKATGGTILQSGGYWYHTFTSSGTFAPTSTLSVDVLVVAGGGGAGEWAAGGGGAGAGGAQGWTGLTAAVGNISVVVGAGGAGSDSTNGVQGSASSFNTSYSTTGGGYGSGVYYGAVGNGGSGGGAVGSIAGGTGISGQGFNGGSGTNSGFGGGGGAGAAGGNGVANTSSGNGGVGTSAFSIWGQATSTGHNVSGTIYYAGGGGGSYGTQTSLGGYGGGGNGVSVNANGTNNAIANTGGGGGANGYASGRFGGNGGSGIVIVRYAA